MISVQYVDGRQQLEVVCNTCGVISHHELGTYLSPLGWKSLGVNVHRCKECNANRPETLRPSHNLKGGGGAAAKASAAGVFLDAGDL